VFQGGFRREAAQQVAGTSLAMLASLVDRSMLRVDAAGRYSLQELLRQFGTELLAEQPEDEAQTRDRHCAYYAQFMQAQWPRLTGSQIKAALTDITTELANVRAAWDWAVTQRKAPEIDMALHSLWFYYGVGNRYQEGEQRFARTAPVFQENKALYGRILAHWGELSLVAGMPDQGHALLLESLALLRQVGSREDIAFVLYRLVLLSFNFPVPMPEAADYLEESLALYTELDNRFGMGEVLVNLGEHYLNEYFEQGQEDSLRRAEHYYVECLRLHQQQSSVFGMCYGHFGLYLLAMTRGDYRQALEHIKRCRLVSQDLGTDWGIIMSLSCTAYAAFKLADFAEVRHCALENLRFNLEHGLSRRQYAADFVIHSILGSLYLAAMLMREAGKQDRAYEVLGVVDQQCRYFEIEPGDPVNILVSPIRPLEDDLPPSLAAAVERGRIMDLETVVKEVIIELSVEPRPVQDDFLTEREMQIIQLIADGLNSREIAAQLYLSVTTVRWYLRQIYSKLDVHSRAECIARARALDLLA
jgi:DNA-binding CsgD family transcriptional regulator